MNVWQLWTGRLLMVSGAFLILATVPIFFPVELMDKIHQWLMGEEMPVSPITIYLARSTSLMYAVHGFVMFYTGYKVTESWGMVKLLGFLHLFIGFTMIWVDINAGMPMYWTAAEGGPIAGLGGLILFLWNKGK